MPSDIKQWATKVSPGSRFDTKTDARASLRRGTLRNDIVTVQAK